MDITMTISRKVSHDDPRIPPYPEGSVGVMGTTTINGRQAGSFVVIKAESARNQTDDTLKDIARPGLRRAFLDLATKDTQRKAAAARTNSDPYAA